MRSVAGPARGASSLASAPETFMTITWDPIWISAGVVAVAEIGDKTQLLAIVLAAKYRRPVPIILGILVATLANHALAAAAGYFIAKVVTGQVFQFLVAGSFLAMAAWTLLPDKADEEASDRKAGGVFLTTLIAFFIVEIGDKTQIATTLLAARFHDIALVTMGTTTGMLVANVPAVLFGEAATRIVPLRYVRVAAAALFVLLGLWVLAGALGLMGSGR